MHWIFWLMIGQVVIGFIVGKVGGISTKHYLKQRGYKFKKAPILVSLSNRLIVSIKMAIPFFGTIVILIMLFLSNERFLQGAIKADAVEKI